MLKEQVLRKKIKILLKQSK